MLKSMSFIESNSHHGHASDMQRATVEYPECIARPPAISAILVGRYLFFITIVFVWAFHLNLSESLHMLRNGSLPIFEGLLTGFFATNVFLSFLDGRSRFQNYKRVKDQLFLRGTKASYLKAVAISRCQREAAMVAATELGLAKEVKKQFHKLGYRWYHFIPDFVFARPFFLTDPHFWKHTFFVPHYTPRFDYRETINRRSTVTHSKRPKQTVRVN